MRFPGIFTTLLVVAGFSSSILACKSRQMVSRSKWLDNGALVLESGSFMPGVLPLVTSVGRGNEIFCTGTAVSDSTLVTAAHCVQHFTLPQNRGREFSGLTRLGKVCVQQSDEKMSCTEQVFAPTAFFAEAGSRAEDNMEFDVAVLVFPSGTFKYFHRLNASDTPAVGSGLIMVGFSEESLFRDEFPKRWGRNVSIPSPADRKPSEIFSEITGSNVVGLSPGDSGGPLLNESCQVVAVASRMDQRSARKKSIHVGFFSKENFQFLENVKASAAARYCGFGDECQDLPGLVSSVHVTSALHFPCKSSLEDSDPQIIAAIRRLRDQRDRNTQQLSAQPINCLEGTDISTRGGAGGTCMQVEWRESAQHGVTCDAAFVSLGGEKVLPRSAIQGLQDAVSKKEAFFHPDRAFEALHNQLKTDGAHMAQTLACGGGGRQACCLQTVCKAVVPSAGSAPPYAGDIVACPAAMKSSETVGRWLADNFPLMFPGVSPQQPDLESSLFPCSMEISMAMRRTKGICYESYSDEGEAVSGFDSRDRGQDFICYAVRAGKKTGQKVSCPSDPVMPNRNGS